MKYLFLSICYILFNNSAFGQVPESCNCIVDTVGYTSFIETLNPDENATFQFHVHGAFAVAYGNIGSTTPGVVQDLIDNFPLVTTIVMHSCPGSEDDVANIEASMLIYNHGYKMYLPLNGWVASGATDMFLAGSIRVITETPESVGVHAWSDGTNDATDFPVGHFEHTLYIDYYKDLGFSQQEAENFYYFTINAAAADDIYWMTETELDEYKIRSCTYSANPSYTATRVETNLLKADLDGASYQWIDCSTNQIIVDSTNQTFSVNWSGDFAVVVTENGCSDTSNCITVITSDINNEKLLRNYNIFPNPFDEIVTIDFGMELSLKNIVLTDVNGRILKKYNNYKEQLLKIEVENKGIYFLMIETEGNKELIRLFNK